MSKINIDNLSTITINDFNELCRICGSNSDLNNLFENDEIINILETCTQLQFSKTDDLPQKICNACQSNAQNFIKFINNCKKIDEIYRQKINKRNAPKIEELYITENFNCHFLLNKDETNEVPEKPENKRMYECEYCDKTYKYQSNLTAHRKLHLNARAHKCDICLKAFNSSSDLKKHERIHQGDRPYKCDVCMKTFTQSYNLKIHKIVHEIKEPLGCDACDKVFKDEILLEKHKKIMHDVLKNKQPMKIFECGICWKIFGTSGQLKRHELTHAEKKINCELCEKKFNNAESLIRHRRMHSGERPYVCKICAKAFNSSSYLRKHERGHATPKCYQLV